MWFGLTGRNASGKTTVVDWLVENGIDRNAIAALPPLQHGDVPGILRKVDAALFPNRCEGGTNLVAMEALAMGVPTILADGTGQRDTVRLAGGGCWPLEGVKATGGPPDAAGVEVDVAQATAALEAIYLDANEPHAYVAGDIVEAMATSDNVVRAGLTPKLRDTDVLCEMLTYNTLKPEILRGEEVCPGVKRYRPPFAEFQVEAIEVAPGASLDIPECPGASILLVQRGGDSTASFTLGKAAPPSEAPISEGGVFFAAANAAVTVSNGGDGPLKIFRCCPNDSVFEG